MIRKKRDGVELSRAEIEGLVNAYTNGEIPDYQVSAWLMAVVLKGMTRPETAALTDAMLHSGDVLDLSSLPAKKVDKHSTGGVGDKTSLVLAPLAAAAGVAVPMISGRGLGHTGGTLDKLEAIPGFNVNLPVAEFRRVLEICGCAMIGQTAEIAPADRKLYALRDVTGTVESPYLICASIMSKKLAEGIDALVLDVKTGSGAFMKSEKDAAFLAELMVETGERMGKQVVALITDMDQPLGNMIGNALEVVEVVEVLRGGGPEDLRELCLELAGWMLHLGGVAETVAEGKQQSAKLISSGKALEKFRQMVELQGGDARVIDDAKRLPQAQHTMQVTSCKGRIRRVHAMRADRHSLRDSRWRTRAQGRFRRSCRGHRAAQESWRSRLPQESRSRRFTTMRKRKGRARPAVDRGELRCDGCSAVDKTAAHPQNHRRSPGRKTEWDVHGNSWPVDHARARLRFLHQSPRHSRAKPWPGAWACRLCLPFSCCAIDYGRRMFQAAGDAATRVLNYAYVGSEFIFGELGKQNSNIGFVFAFQVLPVVIFICALFAILYYFGIMQFIIRIAAWLMTRIMGASGAESLNVAASIFMGQTEAPVTIRPFLPDLTHSELMTVMTSGMAHVSGSIMAAYFAFGAEPRHVLSAVIMTAPGTILVSKMLVPETEQPQDRGPRRNARREIGRKKKIFSARSPAAPATACTWRSTSEPC